MPIDLIDALKLIWIPLMVGIIKFLHSIWRDLKVSREKIHMRIDLQAKEMIQLNELLKIHIALCKQLKEQQRQQGKDLHRSA